MRFGRLPTFPAYASTTALEPGAPSMATPRYLRSGESSGRTSYGTTGAPPESLPESRSAAAADPGPAAEPPGEDDPPEQAVTSAAIRMASSAAQRGRPPRPTGASRVMSPP